MGRARWALALGFLAAGCSGSEDPVGSILREADQLLQPWYQEDATDSAARERLARQTERALDRVREAERLSPDHPQVEHRLGVCLSLLGRYAEAETALADAERHAAPDDLPLILQDQALCALRQGHDRRALATFERVLTLRPWQPDTRYHMGLIYERRGDFTRALELYTEELNHNSGNARAWSAYYHLKGDTPEQGRSLRNTLIILAAWVLVLAAAGAVVLVRRRRAVHHPPE